MSNSSWAISLWQPWASLWLGPKVHETRHWPTRYRGLLHVHAAKRPIRRSDMSDELIALCESEFGGHFWTELPRGAVIGIVELVGCALICNTDVLPEDKYDGICGDFTPGRYAWRRAPDPTPIGPWPYTGRQGLFRCNELDAIANADQHRRVL